MRFSTLFLLSALALAGCQNKAHEVQKLQEQYNAEYPAYAKDCLDEETAGAARMLTGEKLTARELAAFETKKKAREARCKPQADHLAKIQKEILATQQ